MSFCFLSSPGVVWGFLFRSLVFFTAHESRLTLLMLSGLNQPKDSPLKKKKNLNKRLQMKALPYAFPVEDQVASPG